MQHASASATRCAHPRRAHSLAFFFFCTCMASPCASAFFAAFTGPSTAAPCASPTPCLPSRAPRPCARPAPRPARSRPRLLRLLLDGLRRRLVVLVVVVARPVRGHLLVALVAHRVHLNLVVVLLRELLGTPTPRREAARRVVSHGHRACNAPPADALTLAFCICSSFSRSLSCFHASAASLNTSLWADFS